jgi:hypothetical protein
VKNRFQSLPFKFNLQRYTNSPPPMSMSDGSFTPGLLLFSAPGNGASRVVAVQVACASKEA